ncbi:MAG: 7-carboxy-7-deazaguanine synthase QueE [Arcobacteraceae bacterium]
MLEISEIFGPSVQGEGRKIGTPSVFIRFAKCNMSCSGFKVKYETPTGETKYSCDSFYAVDKSFKSQWKSYKSHKELVSEVEKLFLSFKPDIVLTGGEPLLYWNNQEFQKLLEHYIANSFNVTIETNGSLNIDFTQEYQKKILFSLSVKLSNSDEPLKKRVNIEALRTIIEQADAYLKFVVNKEFINTAQQEIEAILKQLPICEVYVMPVGENLEELNSNALSVINMAIENNFNYSDRLHIRLWDNKRGV